MKIKILGTIFCLTIAVLGIAQTVVNGVVKDPKGEPVIGAKVYWMDNSAATISDENGKFALPQKTKERMIHVEFIGFKMAMLTLRANQTDVEIRLEEENTQLGTVTVAGKRGDNMVSSLDARNVERISSNELRKAPCCNLSESFETNGTVDVRYADAVTGAKEIQMLGLRGIYTQLMVENRPDFYGLATPFALEYIPGTWLKSIDINKGVGSVKNGMQSITGQINTALVDPSEQPPAFLNLYGETNGRMEANLHLNKIISSKFAHQLLLHGSTAQQKIDRDNDAFVDQPLKNQLNGMYRGFYSDSKIEAQIFIHALTEKRQSGQLIQNQNIKKPFLIDIENNRLSVTSKIGYLGFKKPYNSLGSQWAATYHDMQSLYGFNRYTGMQQSFYGNVIYATIIGTTDHKLNFGGSFQLDDYTENVVRTNDPLSINLSRTDRVSGVFGEYTYNRPNLAGYNDITIIAGLRADHYNRTNQVFITPRLNLKYNFNEGDAIRFAAGRGVRLANPIAENVAFLATNRRIVVDPNLKPEDAWNFGLNAVKSFKIGNERMARWSADLYRTQFTNQIIADIETDKNLAQFYNLNGKSYANTFLTMLTAEILKGLDLKVSYKYNDVKATYAGKLLEVPLVPKHRGLAAVDFKTPDKKWMFNWTTQFVGSMRLADRSYTPPQYLHHFYPYSPRYTTSNFSINHFFKTIEVYGGVENVFNFTQTQPHPIIGHTDPESLYFDATQVYAPMMGRRIYAGLRWRIGEKQ